MRRLRDVSSALARTPLSQRRLSGRQGSTDPPTKRLAIVRLVVTRGWVCGVNAAAVRRIWSLQARILWARTTRYDEPDQAEREWRELARVDHEQPEDRRLAWRRQRPESASVRECHPTLGRAGA
jgi:hypothetical protein